MKIDKPFLKGSANTFLTKIRQSSSAAMLSVSLIMLFIVFSNLAPNFFTRSNMINLLQQVAVLGITSAGVTLVVLSGNLDLSVGSVMAMASVFAAITIKATDSWILGLLTGLGISFLCGCVNATMINALSMNPLIVTLGMDSILRGVAKIGNRNVNIPILNSTFKFIGQGRVIGIPVVVYILILLYASMAFIMKYTTFGRKAFAVGGNKQASHYSGINVKMISSSIYIMASLFAGVAGLCYSSLIGTGTAAAGESSALDAIAAVVLGGASLAGGNASMPGTFIGVVLLGAISNGLTQLGVNSFTQMVIKGSILLLAVFIDVTKSRKLSRA
jgi:ribose/xylose/arabinose/galactoside ABC-type transport system permease subunit